MANTPLPTPTGTPVPGLDQFKQNLYTGYAANPAVQAEFAAGRLGPHATLEAAIQANPQRVGDIVKANPVKPETPTNTGSIGWQDLLRGPAVMADGSFREIPIGDTVINGQLVENRHGNPDAPAAVYRSEQAAAAAAAPKSAAEQNSAWAKTLPSHLKPRIEKDADGKEVVIIQGSLLNKMMRDMYTAGEENYQLQNMPEPVEPGIPVDQQRLNYAAGMTDPATRTPQNDQRVAAGLGPMQDRMVQVPTRTPYDPRVQMQDTNTPQAEVILRELQKTYPGRSLEDITRILKGG